MTLLVATDHRFFAGESGEILDTYCFDRTFFDDYCAVFPDIRVAARVRRDTPPASARRADGDGVRFFPIPDSTGGAWLKASVRTHPASLKEAVDQADAVCVRVPSFTGTTVARLAREAGKPVMFEAIGDQAQAISWKNDGPAVYLAARWGANAMKRLIARADCGSYVSRAHLQKAYPPRRDALSDSISSIRLDDSFFRSARVFASPPRPLKIVLVASMVPVKRHDVLIDALAAVRAQNVEATLDLVGGGATTEKLKGVAKAAGVADYVTFHGHVASRETLAEILDKSDVFAMTSDSEGMPRSMIEAMSRGLPAVGTAVGGIAEILPSEALVPAGDSVALAALLVRLAGDTQMLNTFAQHSIKTAREFGKDLLSQKRQTLLRHLRALAEKSHG
ncbi:MAG TPA: glycosyltransferase [Abditibacteriaceae bacterium]|jgi:glycosyltransferase involved in cell wall biosynthesis